MAITLDKLATAGNTGGSSLSAAATWSTNPTAGSKAIVVVAWEQSNGALTSVKDNGSTVSTFTQDLLLTDSTNGISVAVYRADNIHLPSSGSYTVTATLANYTYAFVAGATWAGVATGGPAATQHAGPTTGTAVNSGNATPAAANSLAIGGVVDSYSQDITFTVGPGWTTLGYQNNGSTFLAAAAEYQIQSGGPTALAATWTAAQSAAWDAIIAVYSPAGGGNVNVTPSTATVLVAAQLPVPGQALAVPGAAVKIAAYGPVPSPGALIPAALVTVAATPPVPSYPRSVAVPAATVLVAAYPPVVTLSTGLLPGLPQVNDWAAAYIPTYEDLNTYVYDAFTFLTSPPRLRVTQNATQSINPGGQVIYYQNVTEDNYSGWNSVTYTYVAPVSGWWGITAFTGTNIPSTETGELGLAYVLNGIAYGPVWFDNWRTNGTPATFSMYEETYLRAGDSVYVMMRDGAAGYSTDLTYPSTLEIVWLSK